VRPCGGELIKLFGVGQPPRVLVVEPLLHQTQPLFLDCPRIGVAPVAFERVVLIGQQKKAIVDGELRERAAGPGVVVAIGGDVGGVVESLHGGGLS
jgi:hypothetical protein